MLCSFLLRVVSEEVLMNLLICNMYSAITLLPLLPHLPGPNELIVLLFVAPHFRQVKWQVASWKSISSNKARWWIEPLKMLRPQQNSRHLANYIFKYYFLKDGNCIFFHISLKFVPCEANGKKSIDAGSRLPKKTGYKTFPEINLVDVYLCIIRHQWVKED